MGNKIHPMSSVILMPTIFLLYLNCQCYHFQIETKSKTTWPGGKINEFVNWRDLSKLWALLSKSHTAKIPVLFLFPIQHVGSINIGHKTWVTVLELISMWFSYFFYHVNKDRKFYLFFWQHRLYTIFISWGSSA